MPRQVFRMAKVSRLDSRKPRFTDQRGALRLYCGNKSRGILDSRKIHGSSKIPTLDVTAQTRFGAREEEERKISREGIS